MSTIFQKIGGLLATVVHFVSTQLSKLGADAETVEEDLEKVATIADTALNAAKEWVTSPAGRTLLSVIEAIPGVGAIATEIVNVILPGALVAVGVVAADVGDPEKLITDGVTAIAGKADGDAIASAYNSVQALITNKVAPLLNVASDIQSALSVAQTVHAANVGTIAEPVVDEASQAEPVQGETAKDPDMDIVNDTIKANQVPDETLAANGEHAADAPVDGATLSYEEVLKAAGQAPADQK